jgi:hypothetical protein
VLDEGERIPNTHDLFECSMWSQSDDDDEEEEEMRLDE